MKYKFKDYKVSELARFYGVSKDTVRHYDKKKILPAEVQEDNRYRKYNRDGFLMMEYVMRLRKLDIPLDVISNLLNEGTIEETEDILKHRQEEIGEAISQLQHIQSLIINYSKTFQIAKEDMGVFKVREMPAFVIKDIKDSSSATLNDFEEGIRHALPIVTFVPNQDGKIDDGEFSKALCDIEQRSDYVDIVFSAIDWENESEKDDFLKKEFFVIPRGRFLHYSHVVEIHSDYTVRQKFKDYIAEHNLKTRGPFFIRIIGTIENGNVDFYEYWQAIE